MKIVCWGMWHGHTIVRWGGDKESITRWEKICGDQDKIILSQSFDSRLNSLTTSYRIAITRSWVRISPIVYQRQLSTPSLRGRLMSTSKSCGVNGHTTRCTSHIHIRALVGLDGVRLRVNETEISVLKAKVWLYFLLYFIHDTEPRTLQPWHCWADGPSAVSTASALFDQCRSCLQLSAHSAMINNTSHISGKKQKQNTQKTTTTGNVCIRRLHIQ